MINMFLVQVYIHDISPHHIFVPRIFHGHILYPNLNTFHETDKTWREIVSVVKK